MLMEFESRDALVLMLRESVVQRVQIAASSCNAQPYAINIVRGPVCRWLACVLGLRGCALHTRKSDDLGWDGLV
jgi:hypothetical protein